MNVYYVTYPSVKPWCSDFTAINLAKYSENIVTPTHPDNLNQIKNAIIHIHNVQILGKWLRPIKFIEKLQEKGNKVILGLRGFNGLRRYDELFLACDAIAVGVDPDLKRYAENLNKHVHILPPGENPQLFKPSENEKTSDVCWTGRDHKGFKNAELIKQLGFTYQTATYNNYIPHDELPMFYNQSKVLVGFSDYEGFWRPCIEAAMCGLPIVSTPVGVVPEIIDPEFIIPHKARNHLGDYRNKLKQLLDNLEYARNVGESNRLRALKYSWENVAPLYDKAWCDLD